ncbi:MAG: lysine--tRNA ligase [Actinomycetota bacterium]
MNDDTTQNAAPAVNLAAFRERRLDEIAALKARGINPYPYRFDRSHTLGEIRAAHGSLAAGTETTELVAVCGRIMLKRDQGKLIFITVRDRNDEIQLFVSKSVVGDEAFDLINSFDMGDWVGGRGVVMTTRKGELSVKVSEVQLLAKTLRPMPDKWHGLADVDTRFRQRYADLIVNADARRTFEIRHAVIASIRKTYGERGYVEVETPVLHVEAGGAHARPFLTHHNALDMPLYLRIALELHLKRLIVGGMERVFEIGRVFRNEGVSTRHNPEFTMLESYQAFADYNDIMDLTQAVIVNAARDALGTTTIDIAGTACDLSKPWPRERMVDLAGAKVGRELHPSQSVADVRKVAYDNGVKWEKHWGSGRIIESIFAEKAEHELLMPTFVTGHPVEISPLARVDRNDPHLTERFELFVQARELANGFSELNDPVEQRERFEAEQRAKEAGDVTAGTVDEDYLRALEFGLPPTGGLGIGLDRLTMLLAGVSTIREVILFPTLRPEVME